MERTITATELARNLSDILNRVRYRGERFVVERNGERVAALGPVNAIKELTLGQLLNRLQTVPPPDDGFADDLELVQRSQPTVALPEWPS